MSQLAYCRLAWCRIQVNVIRVSVVNVAFSYMFFVIMSFSAMSFSILSVYRCAMANTHSAAWTCCNWWRRTPLEMGSTCPPGQSWCSSQGDAVLVILGEMTRLMLPATTVAAAKVSSAVLRSACVKLLGVKCCSSCCCCCCYCCSCLNCCCCCPCGCMLLLWSLLLLVNWATLAILAVVFSFNLLSSQVFKMAIAMVMMTKKSTFEQTVGAIVLRLNKRLWTDFTFSDPLSKNDVFFNCRSFLKCKISFLVWQI